MNCHFSVDRYSEMEESCSWPVVENLTKSYKHLRQIIGAVWTLIAYSSHIWCLMFWISDADLVFVSCTHTWSWDGDSHLITQNSYNYVYYWTLIPVAELSCSCCGGRQVTVWTCSHKVRIGWRVHWIHLWTTECNQHLEPSGPVMLIREFNNAHLPKDGTLDTGQTASRHP